MTQSALLFAASFAVVFAMGIQHQNWNQRHSAAVFATSLLIGTGYLVQLKVLPGPTSPLDIAAYLVGSACGAVVSMWMHPHLVALFSSASPDATEQQIVPGMVIFQEDLAGTDRAWCAPLVPLVPMPDGPPPSREQRVNDACARLRLATELADEVARSDIESYCPFEKIGTHTWYDTRPPNHNGPEVDAGIAKALRYLDLRGGHGMHRHPQQPHLVRFQA